MIWFDLDNSPHVPLFRPILGELDAKGALYMVTAREFAQTTQLLDFWKIKHRVIGAHGGRWKIQKVLNWIERSAQLRQSVKGRSIDLAVSHGSRTQLLAAWRSKIPSVLMLDYEHTEARIFNALATYLLMPRLIPDNVLAAAGFKLNKVLRYDGFKEELYLADFRPAPDFRDSLGVDQSSILVTIRPPSIVGNYHDELSESLFRTCLEHAASNSEAVCLIVNRTKAEATLAENAIRNHPNVRMLDQPVDGLQLLWHSDVVISGGGTMNRESALLGVPTYSIFTGKRPHLDHILSEQGKLAFITSESHVRSISLNRWNRPPRFSPRTVDLVPSITDLFLDLSLKRHL